MLTLPVTGILKSFFPKLKIIFLGTKYTQPVVDCCEHIDEFAAWDEISGQPKNLQKNFFSSFSADCIVHIFPVKKIALLAKTINIPLRIGTSHRWFHWLYCNRLVHFSRKNSHEHEAQINLKLLLPLGIQKHFSTEELQSYSGFIKIPPLCSDIRRQIDPQRKNIILHPKSKGSAREWGLENFSRLIHLLPESRFKIFITGTKEEERELSSLFSAESHIVNLTGNLSLAEFISFIAASDAFVSASTGPLHIASALGKKAIGIFSPMRPIHPGRWAPIGQNASFFVLNKTCNDCRNNHRCACMAAICPEQVVEKLMC